MARWEFSVDPPRGVSNQKETCLVCGRLFPEGQSWRIRARSHCEILYGGYCSEDEYEDARVALLAKLIDGQRKIIKRLREVHREAMSKAGLPEGCPLAGHVDCDECNSSVL